MNENYKRLGDVILSNFKEGNYKCHYDKPFMTISIASGEVRLTVIFHRGRPDLNHIDVSGIEKPLYSGPKKIWKQISVEAEKIAMNYLQEVRKDCKVTFNKQLERVTKRLELTE